MLKALVVDDERLARAGLISLLAEVEDITVVGEAEDVPSAKKAIEEHDPDLIFLDIQMPGQSGFDLMEEVSFDGRVIFVTAYDEYALRAFEINALDYLMKPVTLDRLQRAVQRVHKEEKRAASDAKEVEQLGNLEKLQYSDRLFLTIGTKVQFLKIDRVVLIQSDGDYTNVFTASGHHGLVTKSMKEWELRLPENYFIRVHRNSIINTEYIEEIEKYFNYSFKVTLKGIEEPVIISRRYAKKLKEVFG